jgi:hypothetical protein
VGSNMNCIAVGVDDCKTHALPSFS